MNAFEILRKKYGPDGIPTPKPSGQPAAPESTGKAGAATGGGSEAAELLRPVGQSSSKLDQQVQQLAELVGRKGVKLYRTNGGYGFKAPECFRRSDPEGYADFARLLMDSPVGKALIASRWAALPLVRYNDQMHRLVYDRFTQQPEMPSECAKSRADKAAAALAGLGAVVVGFGKVGRGQP